MLEQSVHWESQLLKVAFWGSFGGTGIFFKIAIKYRVTHKVLIGIFCLGKGRIGKRRLFTWCTKYSIDFINAYIQPINTDRHVCVIWRKIIL